MKFSTGEEMARIFRGLISDAWISDEKAEKMFFGCQHFLFACCNRLRGFIEWPIVKEAYAKAKIGLGSRSGFMKTQGWGNMGGFRTRALRDSAQFAVFNALTLLLDNQDLGSLQWGLGPTLERLHKHLPGVILERIWNDTVAVEITPRLAAYPMTLRQVAHGIRIRDAYDEVPFVLGDMCEDAGFDEEAKHFHNPECCHTYACRYLHNICKGMDGR